jgi:hypothetical protein
VLEGPESSIPGVSSRPLVKKWTWSGVLDVDTKEASGSEFGKVDITVETAASLASRIKVLLSKIKELRLSGTYPLMNCIHQFLPAFRASEFEFAGINAAEGTALKNLASYMDDEGLVRAALIPGGLRD